MKYDSKKFAKLVRTIKRYTLEKAYVIAFDDKYNVTAMGVVASGTETYCPVDFRDIYNFLMINESNKFIFVHNHPHGGSATPSKYDDDVTDFLLHKQEVYHLEFIDHIIISSDYEEYFSYRDHKWASLSDKIVLKTGGRNLKAKSIKRLKYNKFIRRVGDLHNQCFFLVGVTYDGKVASFASMNSGDFYDIDIDEEELLRLAVNNHFNRYIVIYNHPASYNGDLEFTDYDKTIFEHIKKITEEYQYELIDVIITDKNRNVYSLKKNGYDMGKTQEEYIADIMNEPEETEELMVSSKGETNEEE